jgi:DnaJ-class molecular chaperone
LFLGETISEKDKCKECKGKKVTQQTKVLDVHIDKGMKDKQYIIELPYTMKGKNLRKAAIFHSLRSYLYNLTK